MIDVVCDTCNEYFGPNDARKGGIYMTGWGICPICAEKEHFSDAVPDRAAAPDETFVDFIERCRVMDGWPPSR